MKKIVNAKRSIVAIAIAIAMVLSLAVVPEGEARAEEYSDVYYDANGIRITTSGLKAETEGYSAGTWYIEFYIENNSNNTIKITPLPYSEPAAFINNYPIDAYTLPGCFYPGYTSLTVASKGSNYYRVKASKDELNTFMKNKNISSVSDIFDISIALRIAVLDALNNVIDTIDIPQKSIPLHYTTVNGVSFNQNTYTMIKGQTMYLDNKISVNPNSATNQFTTVTSSDTEAVGVEGIGVTSGVRDGYTSRLYARKPGSVTITATTLDNNVSDICYVDVRAAEPDTAYNIEGEYWYSLWYLDSIISAGRRVALLGDSWSDNKGIRKINTIDGSIPMYRMYNPYTGEHLYTSNHYEAVVNKGYNWEYELDAWYAPSSGEPVYRLYSPGGDHHYTKDVNERDTLVAYHGYVYEGEAWYSGGSVPMYRVFDPKATLGTHHYTSNPAEVAGLVAQGWIDEGIAWYAMR